ncbi:hypothetical protein SLEP1_g35201 [Rubroshorea leprosula]|uniref:Uncharacterized protein n=1 Tax=Rubroshorea leprosula TaxID=152421 RepID=A0AAV5KMK2_9ROSI|nr:hypothetical protein SLEP1_g35201 [Rubroshorea leprosula]
MLVVADLNSSSLLLPLFNLIVAAASSVVNPQVKFNSWDCYYMKLK